MSVKLEWEGKDATIPRLRLPIQVVETINSPRADRGTLFEVAGVHGADAGWRNRLIWGDNLHVLASLTSELAGEVDLVYIDPPFDSRQDYKVRIAVGDERSVAEQELTKISSIIEEKAYRDTWGRGVDSYVHMLYQRLTLIRELLSEQGSLFLHLAPNVSHLARVILDEIFGPENFRAEIIWKRTTAHSDGGQGSRQFGPVHDVIIYFSKTDRYIWNTQETPHDQKYLAAKYPYTEDATGRRYGLWDMTGPGGAAKGNPSYDVMGVTRHWRYSKVRMEQLISEGRVIQPSPGAVPRFKRYMDESGGVPLQDVWTDINAINSQAQERLGYDTQKPEGLLERIIRSASNEGSLVLDCFAGTGTTAAVAERLGRRWIAVDIGRFAVHTTRKRLLDIRNCKPFVVANLGHYERQVWQRETTGPTVQAYFDFIISLYGAAVKLGYQHIHGELAARAVHVGSVDSPVTLAEIKETAQEAGGAGYGALDILGWEWELGLHELVEEVVREYGISVQLRTIPREIMDPRAVKSGEVTFHELAYLSVEKRLKGRKLTVQLSDFVLPNPELIPEAIRSKIKSWADYIDYWAVDFTFGLEGVSDTFRNQWQSFRTQGDRTLTLEAIHEFDEPGDYTVLVKVVDIFGNDTTTSVKVAVK